MSKDVERARLAASIINNPLFDEALAVLKEGYVQASMTCQPSDDLGRWRYSVALRDLVTIKAHIHAVLQRGEIAHQEAEALKERESVFRRAARGFANG